AFAYLARQYTEATNAELSPLLGRSRPECVPSVTGRFVELLSRDKSQREHLRRLEKVLDPLRLG
ncbi:MAG TPA: hypothetical protein VGY53_12895, partial [Isosphaeraceae bacterium]|nr:hypothetical protein [Isosphaeraceae bacterium]